MSECKLLPRVVKYFSMREGERAPTVLVFATEGDANVLGIHALEGLGLEFDPLGWN